MGKSKYRENNRLEIASSLLLSFTLFFFGPLEILLSSPLEFWFSASDVIGLFLISTLLCFSATMGLQYLAAFSRGGAKHAQRLWERLDFAFTYKGIGCLLIMVK